MSTSKPPTPAALERSIDAGVLPPEDLTTTLEVALEAGRQAGEALLEGYRRPGEIRKKGVIDLVTDFDLRAERIVRERLVAAFPTHRIVAEEASSDEEARAAASEELVWYVDPLDGTTNFAHGHPFFCVAIALCRGDDPILGVIVAPALGHQWHAGRGLGAFRDGQPCLVSQTTTLSESLGATGFPYDKWENPDRNVVELEGFLRRTRGIRRCGSAALDLALVADGTYDFYWENRLKPWDLSAGAAIVLEAGGMTSDYQGGAFLPTEGQIVATNGQLHAEVLATLGHARSGGAVKNL